MINLRSAREAKGYTQEDVAAALGVSRVAVTLWESGVNQPSARYLVPLADLLGVSVDYLLGRVPASQS